MRKVIYSPMVSLDGFVEGPNREIDWGSVDEELHSFINDRQNQIDTYLFGRRMYEVMVYWETAESDPSQPGVHSGICAHLAGHTQDRILEDS